MPQHEKFMKECLELAQKGAGRVSPNPMVGSIVLDKNGNIVGKGWHQQYGQAHAEVNALNMAKEKAKGGTIYVSLEPCSHFGKTPPCIDRIIKEEISTLIVGMTDPNPLVAGKGIEKAKAAGIKVIEKILEKECLKLNEVFVKNITQKRPFVALKTASTLDGKIATATGSSKWITSESAREEVQRLRNLYDGILTSSSTVIADNPSLNCRMENGRNPIRIILDKNLKTSPESKVYINDGTRVIIACVENKNSKKYPSNVEIIKCEKDSNGQIDLNDLSSKLYEMKIYSLMVESGGILNGAFLNNGLADKIYIFMAPKILCDNGGKASFDGLEILNIDQCKNFKFEAIKSFLPDVMFELYPIDKEPT